MEELYLAIHYNKKRFIVLFIGMVIITAALVSAMIFDPMPWFGTVLASLIILGSWATGILNYVKFKKWERDYKKIQD